jgi:hypothetical protein
LSSSVEIKYSSLYIHHTSPGKWKKIISQMSLIHVLGLLEFAKTNYFGFKQTYCIFSNVSLQCFFFHFEIFYSYQNNVMENTCIQKKFRVHIVLLVKKNMLCLNWFSHKMFLRN